MEISILPDINESLNTLKNINLYELQKLSVGKEWNVFINKINE